MSALPPPCAFPAIVKGLERSADGGMLAQVLCPRASQVALARVAHQLAGRLPGGVSAGELARPFGYLRALAHACPAGFPDLEVHVCSGKHARPEAPWCGGYCALEGAPVRIGAPHSWGDAAELLRKEVAFLRMLPYAPDAAALAHARAGGGAPLGSARSA
jgi:hypothetical protein